VGYEPTDPYCYGSPGTGNFAEEKNELIFYKGFADFSGMMILLAAHSFSTQSVIFAEGKNLFSCFPHWDTRLKNEQIG
jgi:hypothetical protein